MASLTPRVTLCTALVGLLCGCASGPRPAEGDVSTFGPTPAPPVAANTVTGDELDRAGSDPIEKTLEAKVPGIMVARAPDGGIVIRIRGNTSIGANNEPLFIIDGMEVHPGPGGSLSGINPHDIASIEVLKDAASLSFYGVRAANGVILIKTKRTTN